MKGHSGFVEVLRYVSEVWLILKKMGVEHVLEVVMGLSR
jgi:hypothetical protein